MTHTTSKPFRLAYLVSHPIQYQAPLLRSIAKSPKIDLTVFFLSDFSVRGYQDPGFNTTVEWDVPLLDGYHSVFLPAIGKADHVTSLRPLTVGLRHHLSQGGFDALWLHGYSHPVNIRAMLVAKQLGLKVLLRAEVHAACAIGTGAWRKAKETLIRRIFRTADGFLAIGSLNRDYYLSYGVPPDRIFSMPYAVDNAFFQSRVASAREHREELRAKLGLEPGRPIILCASRFIARKRIDDLISAYAGLSADGTPPRPYLLLIGDGEERTTLEAQVKSLGWPTIKFLGFKNQTELPAYYDLCDVFVLVSETEPWALIVNEVMNAAKPVILSDQVGSAYDLVKEGDNGFVIPTGDVAMLTERLRRLVSASGEAARMGENSLATIDHWGIPEDVAGLEQALEATVGSKAACVPA